MKRITALMLALALALASCKKQDLPYPDEATPTPPSNPSASLPSNAEVDQPSPAAQQKPEPKSTANRPKMIAPPESVLKNSLYKLAPDTTGIDQKKYEDQKQTVLSSLEKHSPEQVYAFFVHMLNSCAHAGYYDGFKDAIATIEQNFENPDHGWYLPRAAVRFTIRTQQWPEYGKRIEIIRLGSKSTNERLQSPRLDQSNIQELKSYLNIFAHHEELIYKQSQKK